MTDSTKEYMQHSFRFGSLIGFVTFIYYVVGFYLGFEKGQWFDDVYFFIEIAMIAWMMVAYKKTQIDNRVKFSRYFMLGLIASLVISLFYVIYFVVRVTKLDVLFFDNYMNEAITQLKTMGIDYSKVFTQQNKPFFEVVFFISIYIGNLISNLFYVLLLSWFMSLNNRMYNMNNRNNNQNNNNNNQ
jgi:uncharacterized membrane protein YhdT